MRGHTLRTPAPRACSEERVHAHTRACVLGGACAHIRCLGARVRAQRRLFICTCWRVLMALNRALSSPLQGAQGEYAEIDDPNPYQGGGAEWLKNPV
jgi:hypothetical protein